MECPYCGNNVSHIAYTPPEPPLGTWIEDKYGAKAVRIIDSDGHDGWAPHESGFYACARWENMWEARGPLKIITKGNA